MQLDQNMIADSFLYKTTPNGKSKNFYNCNDYSPTAYMQLRNDADFETKVEEQNANQYFCQNEEANN